MVSIDPFLQTQSRRYKLHEMEWGEQEEEYNPGVPVFNGVPLESLCLFA